MALKKEWFDYNADLNMDVLIGKVFTHVHQNGDEEIIFTCSDGKVFKIYHDQTCCETVDIESITGDLNSLVGHPILVSELSMSEGDSEDGYSSCTWSFYKLATINGYVDIRWYGESNGYYSEKVSLRRIS